MKELNATVGVFESHDVAAKAIEKLKEVRRRSPKGSIATTPPTVYDEVQA